MSNESENHFTIISTITSDKICYIIKPSLKQVYTYIMIIFELYILIIIQIIIYICKNNKIIIYFLILTIIISESI